MRQGSIHPLVSATPLTGHTPSQDDREGVCGFISEEGKKEDILVARYRKFVLSLMEQKNTEDRIQNAVEPSGMVI